MGLTVLMMLTLGCGAGGGDESASEPKASKIETVYDKCQTEAAVPGGLRPMEEGTLADDGHTVVLEGMTEEEDFEGLACLMDGLGTPQSVRSSMESTTSLMGRQSAEVEGLKYEWSYHPDNGMDLIITDI